MHTKAIFAVAIATLMIQVHAQDAVEPVAIVDAVVVDATSVSGSVAVPSGSVAIVATPTEAEENEDKKSDKEDKEDKKDKDDEDDDDDEDKKKHKKHRKHKKEKEEEEEEKEVEPSEVEADKVNAAAAEAIQEKKENDEEEKKDDEKKDDEKKDDEKKPINSNTDEVEEVSKEDSIAAAGVNPSNKIMKKDEDDDEKEEKDDDKEKEDEDLEAAGAIESAVDSVLSSISMDFTSSSYLAVPSGLSLSLVPSGSAPHMSATPKVTGISNKKASSGNMVRVSVGVSVGAMLVAAFTLF